MVAMPSGRSNTDHLRGEQACERTTKRMPAALIHPDSAERRGGGFVLAELAHHLDHIGVTQEGEAAISEVVCQRAERLRPERHLRVELVALREIERDLGGVDRVDQ